MFFEMGLSRCVIMVGMAQRFPDSGFHVLAFLTLSALPHTKKISRSARNDGVGARLHEAEHHYGWLCP